MLIEVSEANFEGFRSMATTMAIAMTLCVAVAASARGEGYSTAGGGGGELPAPRTCWSKSMIEPVIMPLSALER